MKEKNNSCSYCGKNTAGGPEWIVFEKGGFRFRVFKSGGTCFECEKKKTIKRLKEYGFARGLVKLEDGRVKIDWREYLLMYQGEGAWKQVYTHILVDLGILALTDNGNWGMTARGIGMNPYSSGAYLFFTREEDVLAYAYLRGKDTLFDWSVRQFGKDNFQKSYSKPRVLSRAIK